MRRIQLKSKEINKQLSNYNLSLSKKDQVELLGNGSHKLIMVNKQPAFFYYKNSQDVENIIPTLKYLQTNPNLLKKITIDMGAVKFVVNGADIMRPGITKIEAEIKQNDFIVIIDENNQKPLAVGIALFSSEEMQSSSSGKVIKNIHYVGDEIWNFELK